MYPAVPKAKPANVPATRRGQKSWRNQLGPGQAHRYTIKAGPAVPISTPNKSVVIQCAVAPSDFALFQRSDSGTNKRISKVKMAGTAPIIMINRQPLFLRRTSIHGGDKPSPDSIQ